MRAGEEKQYHLNIYQKRILGLIYKYRYITIPLLQKYLGLKHPSTIWHRLKRLEQQGYISSLYDTSFIKQEKPAYFFLDKKGLAFFKDDPRTDPLVLHSYRKNKILSEEYRQHYLDVFAVYNSLRSSYADQYAIYTKSEQVKIEDMPSLKPDLYLRKADGTSEYFVSLVHDIAPYLARKQLMAYLTHSEEDGWPGGQYPTLLFICKTQAHVTALLSYSETLREDMGMTPDELPITATTFEAVTTTPYDSTVWMYSTSKFPVSLE